MRIPSIACIGRTCVGFLIVSLAGVFVWPMVSAAELPPHIYQPTNDEFSAVSQAVVQLLQTRDVRHFTDTLAPSKKDWKDILDTNLPGNDPNKWADSTRLQIGSSVKALLKRADDLHLDFSKGDLHPRVLLPKSLGSIRFAERADGQSLPYAQNLEIVLNPNFITNNSGHGDFKIVLRGMTKFPGGWRFMNGCAWESFPDNVADEQTRHELALLAKVGDYKGFDAQDDPTLLKLGQTLVHFIQSEDTGIYQTDAVVNADMVWAMIQKMAHEQGDKGPSRQEVDQEIGIRTKQQVEIARKLLKQMDDAGIDLKDADIQIKDASVERAQAHSQDGSLDGMTGNQFKLTLEVNSTGKSKNGGSLSGEYILAANEITRIDGAWKIEDNIHWYQFPNLVVDDKTLAAMQFEDYVGQHRALPPHSTVPEIEFVTLDGEKKMKLSDLRGKVVVLDFWATWCGPCQGPMADLQTLRHEHPDWKDKVAIVQLSIDDTIDVLRNHLDKHGWTNTFNVWAGDGGWESKPALAFRVTGVPTTYIIDQQGMIVRSGHPVGMNIGREVDVLLKNSSSQVDSSQ